MSALFNPFRASLATAVAIALGCAHLAACAQPEPKGPRSAEEEPPLLEQLEDDGATGPPRDPACPEHLPFVASVRARVVDAAGDGLADARLQLCVWTDEPRMLCLEPAVSDAHGDVLVEVAPAARCMISATARVLLPQSRRPALYCDLELSSEDASHTVLDPYVLLEAPAPLSVPSVGDESSVRLVDLGGVQVEATPAAIGVEEYQRMAALTLPLDRAPRCLADRAPAFDMLVAFSPEVDITGAGFSFSLDNSIGATSGDPLGVFVQGGIDCRTPDGTLLEKGAWHPLGDARVTEDGERIEGEGDSALPCLGWIGLLR